MSSWSFRWKVSGGVELGQIPFEEMRWDFQLDPGL